MHVLYCALEEDLFRSKHYVSLTFASLSKQIVTTPTYYGITLLSTEYYVSATQGLDILHSQPKQTSALVAMQLSHTNNNPFYHSAVHY